MSSVAAINQHAAAAANLAASGKSAALRNLPQAEQVRAAAGQFEAIILRQLLQDSVGKIAGEGAAGGVYGYMLTDVLANKLSEAGGLGLSGMLQQQLSPRAPKEPASSPAQGTS